MENTILDLDTLETKKYYIKYKGGEYEVLIPTIQQLINILAVAKKVEQSTERDVESITQDFEKLHEYIMDIIQGFPKDTKLTIRQMLAIINVVMSIVTPDTGVSKPATQKKIT